MRLHAGYCGAWQGCHSSVYCKPETLAVIKRNKMGDWRVCWRSVETLTVVLTRPLMLYVKRGISMVLENRKPIGECSVQE